MLDKLLQIVGVDLQTQLAQVTARAVAFKDATRREIRAEVAHAGVIAALAFVALVALTAACVIALIVLYLWLKPQYGALFSLGIIGSVTVVFGFVMAMLAMTRKAPSAVVMSEPVVTQRPAPASPVNLAAMVTPLPPHASLFDVVAHRVSSRAAGVAEEAIDTAEDTIAHGSRTQLVGTVAVAIMVGWIVGRRGGL
jgi:hypothetical protein